MPAFRIVEDSISLLRVEQRGVPRVACRTIPYNARMETERRMEHPLLDIVRATIRRHDMLPRAGTVVVGVSGGPDSLALLHLLQTLVRREWPGITLRVCHVNHCMRGRAADDDADFVRAQCEQLGVSYHPYHVLIARVAAAKGMSEEVAGRYSRYRYLEDLSMQTAAVRIAVGHHANDQAETVLLRLKRGAGPRGMGGIPYVRRAERDRNALIIRPLLDCTRAEIEAFLREKGLAARFDATNLWMKYPRNRVRHRLIPALAEQWGDSLQADLCRFANASQRMTAAASGIVERLLGGPALRIQKGYAEIDLAVLQRCSASLCGEAVRHAMDRAGLLTKMLSAEHYDSVARIVEFGEGSTTLPGGVVATAEAGTLFLVAADDAFGRAFDATLIVPGVTRIPDIGVEFHAEIPDYRPELLAEKMARNDPNEALFDFEKLALPLWVRFRRPGDRMRPLGAPGTRKLQDIFTDAHIPRPKRARVPLVLSGKSPVWIVGGPVAQRACVGDRTRRALHLRVG